MTKMYMRGGVYFGTAADMMDRIDELEAKLDKAVAALYAISGRVPYADDPYDIARTTLAELKEETHE